MERLCRDYCILYTSNTHGEDPPKISDNDNSARHKCVYFALCEEVCGDDRGASISANCHPYTHTRHRHTHTQRPIYTQYISIAQIRASGWKRAHTCNRCTLLGCLLPADPTVIAVHCTLPRARRAAR